MVPPDSSTRLKSFNQVCDGGFIEVRSNHSVYRGSLSGQYFDSSNTQSATSACSSLTVEDEVDPTVTYPVFDGTKSELECYEQWRDGNPDPD